MQSSKKRCRLIAFRLDRPGRREAASGHGTK
jgi:hypothetical protein